MHLPRNLFVRRLQIRKFVFFNQAEFAKHVQSTVNRRQTKRLVFFSRPVQNLVHRKMGFRILQHLKQRPPGRCQIDSLFLKYFLKKRHEFPHKKC